MNGELKTSIQRGLSLLVGFTHEDTEKDLDYMVNKCLNLRVYEDKERNRSWDLSVKSLNLEVLVISQFTLYSKVKGGLSLTEFQSVFEAFKLLTHLIFLQTTLGNKPDFHNAMGTEKAEAMYDLFVKKMRESYQPELVKGK